MLFVHRLAPAGAAAPAQQQAPIGVTGQLVLTQAAHRAAVAHAAAVAAAARAAAARAAAARAAAARAAAARAAAARAAARAAAARAAAERAAQAAAQQAAQRAAVGQAAVQQAPAAQAGGTQVDAATKTSAPAPAGSPQEIAQQLLAQFGWAGQFSCLDSLWERESGWNVNADNPSSGAYGIPQALPGSKMSSAGSDWQTDAATQIRWGLSYIGATYGSPCGAWSHEVADGWY